MSNRNIMSALKEKRAQDLLLEYGIDTTRDSRLPEEIVAFYQQAGIIPTAHEVQVDVNTSETNEV